MSTAIAFLALLHCCFAITSLTDSGFESEGNTSLEGISYSINGSTQWVPTYAFRFYRNKGLSKGRLAFISVLLDDNVVDGDYTIKEPYATGGFLDFGILNASLDGNYWFARYFGYMLKEQQAIPDGTVYSFINDGKDSKVKFQNGKVFGIPLVNVRNSQDIEKQITEKLIDLFKKS